MKKILSLVIAFCLLISCNAFADDSAFPKVVSSSFKSSSESFVGEGSFYYDENAFGNSAYRYNHSLAKSSVRFAMSAFAVSGNNYKNQFVNADDILKKMSYTDIAWNEDYTIKPDVNTIGVIAGCKKVTFGDKTCNLIAVTVRGGEYEAEWGGNFNVGNGEIHEGFKIAGDKVIAFLKEYVKKNNITGETKIWITGYSRGAAVANLTAVYLDDNAAALGTNVIVSPENIYAYCFEAPANIKVSENKELYGNIFNISSHRDFVTMIPPEKWGYGLLGNTYYLPSPETNTSYYELANRMMPVFNEYLSEQSGKNDIVYKPFYEFYYSLSLTSGISLVGENTSDPAAGEKYIKGLANTLSSAYESREDYVKNYQECFISFGKNIIGTKRTSEFLEVVMAELMSGLSVSEMAMFMLNTYTGSELDSSMKQSFYDAISSASEKMNMEIDEKTADAVFLIISKLVSEHKLENLIGNADYISLGHYPEYCMAWLDVIDETEYTDSNNKFVLKRDDSIKVVLNGKRIEFDQEPVIENGRTLVPLRKIFEALGATVEWNQETQTVTSVKDDTTIVLTIGNNIMYVNGREVELDVPAKILNNRTLAPARAVAEGFNCDVDWNNDTRTVIITK